jgi:hypothetical protein
VITPDVVRAQFVERYADVLAEVLDCFQVRAEGRGSELRCGVVPWAETKG